MLKYKEEWENIEGYEGLYQVSSLGRVRSLPRITIKIDGNKYSFKGRILKLTPDTKGYYMVGLSKKDNIKTKRVHRLVAEAFISNPNNLRTVDHINEDKTDNRIENLQWLSLKDNINKYYKNRLTICKAPQKCEDCRAYVTRGGWISTPSGGYDDSWEECIFKHKKEIE